MFKLWFVKLYFIIVLHFIFELWNESPLRAANWALLFCTRFYTRHRCPAVAWCTLPIAKYIYFNLISISIFHLKKSFSKPQRVNRLDPVVYLVWLSENVNQKLRYCIPFVNVFRIFKPSMWWDSGRYDYWSNSTAFC